MLNPATSKVRELIQDPPASEIMSTSLVVYISKISTLANTGYIYR